MQKDDSVYIGHMLDLARKAAPPVRACQEFPANGNKVVACVEGSASVETLRHAHRNPYFIGRLNETRRPVYAA